MRMSTESFRPLDPQCHFQRSGPSPTTGCSRSVPVYVHQRTLPNTHKYDAVAIPRCHPCYPREPRQVGYENATDSA
jgi:hypothetical protein